MGEVGRYAPSTTGPAHPGTLLAALLCWLDARSAGARIELRLEDLDPERARPEWTAAMCEDLEWLGLDWDAVRTQNEHATAHEAALDRLAEEDLLYPCRCSRADLKRVGERTPDGGYRYPNTCRMRSLPGAAEGGWRASVDPLRVRLPAGVIEPEDVGGLDLSQDPVAAFGDPIVRRRDGAIAYHLACVVDDAAIGVTRVVRGRDLATSTATQVALQRCLGFETPRYRHHLLLLERREQKLAKLHGSVGTPELRDAYGPERLCGFLAHAAGLVDVPDDITPAELIEVFSWEQVGVHDRLVLWDGESLALAES